MKITIETKDYDKISNLTKWQVGKRSAFAIGETDLKDAKEFYSLEDAKFYQQHERAVNDKYLTIVEVRTFAGRRVVQ